MKSGKTFTIDIDLLLKKPTSKLVNELLREYYKQAGGECAHEWTTWGAVPSGLARECRLCGAVETKET